MAHCRLIRHYGRGGEGTYELATGVHIELRVDARDVGFHGSLSDVQLLSDCLGREALGRKSRDLALPVGERGGATESASRTPARLAEVVEVRQDLVATPAAAARREQVRRVTQSANCLLTVDGAEGTAELRKASGFQRLITTVLAAGLFAWLRAQTSPRVDLSAPDPSARPGSGRPEESPRAGARPLFG